MQQAENKKKREKDEKLSWKTGNLIQIQILTRPASSAVQRRELKKKSAECPFTAENRMPAVSGQFKDFQRS